MQTLKTQNINEIAVQLLDGKIGILPTDTIYGIHCIANQKALIEKIYKIKERPPEKKFITLISNAQQLDQFNLKISKIHKKLMQEKWPGRNTIIFEDSNGTTHSFRLPDNKFLIQLINITGPLVSTSANKHGESNIKNITEGIEIFGDEIDFYVDGGILEDSASSVYIIENEELKQLR